MGRAPRAAEGGLIYHVWNRANGRIALFGDPPDYQAFDRILSQAVRAQEMRLLAYCVMPNHWHLLLWPAHDGDLSRFVRWVTLTHTQRWHAHRRTAGSGHLYQGRFKSSPVQSDEHFLTVCRYVERNALRANLVARAEDWPWGSLSLGSALSATRPTQAAWPIERPPDWLDRVNRPHSPTEEEALRRALVRGQAYGDPEWRALATARLGLESTLRPRGRPRKTRNEGTIGS